MQTGRRRRGKKTTTTGRRISGSDGVRKGTELNSRSRVISLRVVVVPGLWHGKGYWKLLGLRDTENGEEMEEQWWTFNQFLYDWQRVVWSGTEEEWIAEEDSRIE